MREIMLKEPVELKLPAQQNMMLVMRLTTAGVIARAGLTVDRINDVKLAVEEACSCLIQAASNPKTLCLRFFEDEAGLKIRICGDCVCSGEEDTEDELSVVKCILESLVDGVVLHTHGNDVGSIELHINLPE